MVYLDAFYIDIYEVTNDLYAECVDAGACDLPGCNYYGRSEYSDHPVVCVSWYQAQAYCQWREGSLPTEAEWEKAARGGLHGAVYPWGDDSPVCRKGVANGAKFDDNAGCNDTGTEPVGSYGPNGYGLFDMTGNVWEWVLDWYSARYYDSSTFRDPIGPNSGDYRVARGGSWSDVDGVVRTAYRSRVYPDEARYDIGFRCARPR